MLTFYSPGLRLYNVRRVFASALYGGGIFGGHVQFCEGGRTIFSIAKIERKGSVESKLRDL